MALPPKDQSCMAIWTVSIAMRFLVTKKARMCFVLMDGKPTIVSCSNKLTIQEGGMGGPEPFH